MDTNVIYCGDSRAVLPNYVRNKSVDLIYIDPPFNTSRKYEIIWGEAPERRSWDDRAGDPMKYLRWMRPFLGHLYDALKDTGTFYYHCDWHASHYIKVELDRLFGSSNFRSEIVWERATAHHDSKGFRRVHDTILAYSKTKNYTFNRQFGLYSDSYIESHYSLIDESGRRYQLDNVTSPSPRPNMTYEWRGIAPPRMGWRFSKETMARLEAQGRIVQTKTGRPRYKRYLDEMPGVPLGDVWTDIPPVNSQAAQRIGYPTQKPVPLLERIVEASSKEGDLVLDAFCGCGTTLEAAAKLGRKWIGIDESPNACRIMGQRLEERLGLRPDVDFHIRDLPKDETQLRLMKHEDFESWAVLALGGVPNRVKVGDFGIDGRLYAADHPRRSRPPKVKAPRASRSLFEDIENWYPIQVKQKDKVDRPDIDAFESAMRRDKRVQGYFIAFGFSEGAKREIKRVANDGLDITPITVKELLEYERRVA